MSATLDDLRGALADAADRVVAPSPDATVDGARQHRAAAARRRRSGVAALTLVAVAAVGGALGSRGPEHRSAPVLPAVRTVTDSSFATYQDGLRLVQVNEVPVTDALVLTPLTLPRPAAGGLWAEVHCPGDPARADGAWQNALTLSAGDGIGGRAALLSCSPGGPPSPLDSATQIVEAGDQRREVQVTVQAGAPPSGTMMRIGLYEPVPFAAYPFDRDPRATALLPDIEGNPITRTASRPGDSNAPVTLTVPYRPHLRLVLASRTHGRLTMSANGVPVSRSPWWQDNDLSDGSLVFWRPQVREISLDDWLRAGGVRAKPGRPVTIAIQPADFGPRGWTLTVLR